ncbi:DUF5133 domain-containing protein [Streptomyces sp. NBC_01476]|uniref:DUF5133 domain-containing protein n=1 Tax=Streptomyces sp. NBC_01476 TaxID=2903881 RepID=UPI002E37EA4A|nr:DUF5133 domain-containing protein [Streptomyces sp. NBC_01476]
MMWANPAVLQELIERYERLTAQAEGGGATPQVTSQLRDTAYTLCVSTGTRDVEAALRAARRRLDGAEEAGGHSTAGAV